MNTRKFSRNQENRVAKNLGGRVVANSGATRFNKGDVNLPEWLIECKTLTRPQTTFTLKKEWFIKNEEEAFSMNKEHSAIVFNFGDNKDYYIISAEEMKQYLQLLERNEI